MTDTVPTFTDRTGCTWRLEFTGSMVASLKADCGIDLASMVQTYCGIRRVFGEGRVMARRVAEILFTVCEKQITAEGLSPEAFARLILPPVFDKAVDALFTAIACAFPTSPFGRAHRSTEKES